MTVTEVKQALGSWNVQLREGTPREVLDALTYFGHIAVLPGRVEPTQFGDNLLTSARYVGVYRNRDADNKYVIQGSGMAYWLGDEEDKGDILESPVAISGATFPNAVRALLPPGGSITEGTLYSIAGTYTGRHQWTTPREAITYVTDIFGGEWRVTSTGTLDAGPIANLYVTTPKTVLLRKGFGTDLQRRAIPGEMSMTTDVEDVTTRLVLLAEGEGSSIATAAANAPATLYKDIHGNAIKITRLVSESSTETTNAAARAQVQLNRVVNARRSVDLSTSEYDVKGSFVVGDYLDVYDPENGFYDANREVYWQGERINPMALRCVEMSWPIPAGWTVAFRDINGVWIDLSNYYVGDTGDTTIVVGELSRGLASVSGEAVGVRPNLPDAVVPVDTTIPAAPAFTGFSTGSYESDDHTLAAIYAQWAQPLNGDGSTILDGDHYEIRHRPNTVIGTSTPWDYLGGGFAVDFSDDFNTPVVGGFGTGWASIGGTTEHSVSGGEAQIAHPTFSLVRGQQRTSPTYADVEVVLSNKISYAPAGASTVMGAFLRRVDANNMYWVRAEPNVDQTITVKITRYKAGVFSELAVLKIAGMTHVPNTEIWLRANLTSNVISAKVWQGTIDDEPDRDTIGVIDTDVITGAGTAGIMDYIVSGSTNPLGSVTRHPYFQARSLASDNIANAYTWDGLGTWDALTSVPVVATPNWTTSYVGWDQTAFTLVGLGPGVQYELQIRALDQSSHFSPWSVSSFVNTSGDAISPSEPAPPEVSASMIAVQLVHRLGKASGGTFNLEQDLHHFDVHTAATPTFYPDDATKVGELLASGSMIRGGIPAVGTFKVDQASTVWIRVVAVDRTGNKSGPSEAVQSSVVLIDNAHISDLSVSKLTAGTITANTILAGQMEVGAGGNIKLTEGSLDVYNNLGVKVVESGKLSDGSYGLAAVHPLTGALGKLSDVIFGPQVDSVTSLEAVTLPRFGAWQDLGGPTVTVGVGESGRVLILLTARWDYNGASSGATMGSTGGMMGFEASGANVIAPVEQYSVITAFSINGTASNLSFIVEDRKTATVFLEGLNPGLTTFSTRYQKYFNTSGAVQVMDREIAVFPY